MRLPDFLIVGAMKAATSSFALDLSYHPQIFVTPKEIHFFNSEKNYQKGIQHYSESFSRAPLKTIVGEKTPSYSYHPQVPKRIAHHIPQVKIIWLLREPVSRSYSHYNFFVAKGRERRSFEKAVNRELKGKEIHFTQRYLDRSIYVKQINRYLQYFPRSQMLFLLYEDYRKNKAEVLAKAYQFLGIGEQFSIPSASLPQNVTFLPNSSFIQWAAYSIFRPRGFRIYRLITRLNRRKKPGYKPMDYKMLKYLRDYFQPYNAELSRLTGLDLRIWLDM